MSSTVYITDILPPLQLFQCCLINLQNESLLNEIETEKVFGNVSDVYQANAEFWSRSLVKVVQHSRQTRGFLDPTLLKSGFMQVWLAYT